MYYQLCDNMYMISDTRPWPLTEEMKNICILHNVEKL